MEQQKVIEPFRKRVFLKFKEQDVGYQVKGTLARFSQGKFGENVEIETPYKVYVIGMKAGLTPLKKLELGAEVCITYKGEKMSKSGHMFYELDVEEIKDE